LDFWRFGELNNRAYGWMMTETLETLCTIDFFKYWGEYTYIQLSTMANFSPKRSHASARKTSSVRMHAKADKSLRPTARSPSESQLVSSTQGDGNDPIEVDDESSVGDDDAIGSDVDPKKHLRASFIFCLSFLCHLLVSHRGPQTHLALAYLQLFQIGRRNQARRQPPLSFFYLCC
jgi:hypothetical protein